MDRFMKWLDDLTYPYKVRNIKNFSLKRMVKNFDFKQDWLNGLYLIVSIILIAMALGMKESFGSLVPIAAIFVWGIIAIATVISQSAKHMYSWKTVFVNVMLSLLWLAIAGSRNGLGHGSELLSLVLCFAFLVRALMDCYQLLKRRLTMKR